MTNVLVCDDRRGARAVADERLEQALRFAIDLRAEPSGPQASRGVASAGSVCSTSTYSQRRSSCRAGRARLEGLSPPAAVPRRAAVAVAVGDDELAVERPVVEVDRAERDARAA